MARLIVLDEGLSAALADELRGRGRPAATLAELGLAPGALDAEVLAAVAGEGGVLITPYPLAPGEAPVAVIAPAGAAERRDAVHRHAAAIAAQRVAVRRYG